MCNEMFEKGKVLYFSLGVSKVRNLVRVIGNVLTLQAKGYNVECTVL